jgi:hypothetical protein
MVPAGTFQDERQKFEFAPTDTGVLIVNPDRRTIAQDSRFQSPDVGRPLDRFPPQNAALRRSYRSRRSRRPANTPYGTAVLALALELEGFLTVFDLPVTARTPSPRSRALHFVNQGLTNY